MRRLASTTLLFAALAALPLPAARADDAQGADDRLHLSDRQTMAGDFLGFTAGQGAQFRHPACDGVLTVKADHLDALFPHPSPAGTGAPEADWRVSLHNGDVLIGKLVSYAPDKLILDMPFAGRLEISSAAVIALAPLAAPNVPGSLSGLGKAEDWRTPPAAQAFALILGAGARPQPQAETPPTITDGKLLVRAAGAMRTLDMRPQSRLDLTLEGSPVFSVEFASEPDAGGKETSYVFQVYPRHVGVNHVMRAPGSMRSQSCGSFPRAAAKPEATALSFLSDARGGRVTVVADGEKIGSVALPIATAGKRLVLRTRGGDLRLTRLALTPGATLPETGAQARAATDTAALANGDKAEGTLLAIAGGKASFKTEAGTMDLPVARLRGLTLSAAHNLAQAADKDAVRIHFGDDCRLTLKVAQIKDGILSGSAAGLGNVAFRIGGAEKIVFNPEAKMPSRETRADAAQENAAQAPDAFQGGIFQGGIFQGGVIQGGNIQVFGAEGALQAIPDIRLRQVLPEGRNQNKKEAKEGGAQEAPPKQDDAPAPGQVI